MATQRTYTRYCPELEREISCTVVGEAADGRKVWASPEDGAHQFILMGGDFRILTESGYDDL